jgi:hypothetical protein
MGQLPLILRRDSNDGRRGVAARSYLQPQLSLIGHKGDNEHDSPPLTPTILHESMACYEAVIYPMHCHRLAIHWELPLLAVSISQSRIGGVGCRVRSTCGGESIKTATGKGG